MIISLNPIASLPGINDPITVSVLGDAITINGLEFDLSNMPNGAALPASAIDSSIFCGDVVRENGELSITLLYPVCEGSTVAACFPEPIHVAEDGLVELPI